MKKDLANSKIVVIGGGTGSFVVLSGLKKYFNNITALVSMADDGGSTGQLRDELGVLPPGDVRQCLVALSESPKVRDLFNYRFDEGSLKGHSFGNLFLTALEKMTGNFAEAVDVASDVLDINGHAVIPITLEKVGLIANDGERDIIGESEIREAEFTEQRPKLSLEPVAKVNPEAIKAIEEADLIVVAPGGLYESLGAALIIPGVGDALHKSSAEKVYICNLMNQDKHVKDFAVNDYVDELERLAGAKFVDKVIYNVNRPNDEILERYALEGDHPVLINEDNLAKAHYKSYGVDLLSDSIWQNSSKSDPLAAQRSLIRHDSDKLAKNLIEVVE